MKTSTEGFQQCYNAQMTVDGEPAGGRGRGDGQRERPGPTDPDARRGPYSAMSITCSAMSITDVHACRSPWESGGP